MNDINDATRQAISSVEQAIEEVDAAVVVLNVQYFPDRVLREHLLDMQEAMQYIELHELKNLKETVGK